MVCEAECEKGLAELQSCQYCILGVDANAMSRTTSRTGFTPEMGRRLRALRKAGAKGLMQVMPFWKAEIGRPDDNLIDLATNLQYGCTILKFYLDKENGNLRRALARYNGSLGSNRYPDRVLDYWYSYWYVKD